MFCYFEMIDNLLDLHFRYIKNISRALTWNEIYPTKQIDKLIKNVNEMNETFLKETFLLQFE